MQSSIPSLILPPDGVETTKREARTGSVDQEAPEGKEPPAPLASDPLLPTDRLLPTDPTAQ